MITSHRIRKAVIGLIMAGAFFILSTPIAINAQETTAERITNFHSDITVHDDGSMNVTEMITVVSAGDQIKHGMYRDFPTSYQSGVLTRKVGFKIISVQRDGHTEAYHTAALRNGIRIYIGDQNVLLPPDTYTYQLAYWTNRQLGFFTDHDELYWNVTGQEWQFPISQTSATVHLPGDIVADTITTTGYAGITNSNTPNVQSTITNTNISFTYGDALSPGEGMTIVVGWPKGHITYPTGTQDALNTLADNIIVVLSIIGMLVITAYYFVTWRRIGVNPKKGTIIPEYEPPAGFSPAAVRFLQKMGFDNKIFVAQIIDMAVRGLIRIKNAATYQLEKTAATPTDTVDQKILQSLSITSTGTIELNNKNYQKMRDAKVALGNILAQQMIPTYFTTGIKYIAHGALLSLAIFLIIVLNNNPTNTIHFSFSINTFFIIIAVYLAVYFSKKKRAGTVDASLIIIMTTSMVLVILFISNITSTNAAASLASAPIIIDFVYIASITVLFIFLLKAPTVAGRKILDHIDGFKWFLSVTEKDRMNFRNPPDKTPELFEKYLPYALALGVENKWSEQFADVFARLEQTGHPYVPVWYVGSNFNATRVGDFSTSLGHSFAHAISAASNPPGSSSGFGGGAGGGGGGW